MKRIVKYLIVLLLIIVTFVVKNTFFNSYAYDINDLNEYTKLSNYKIDYNDSLITIESNLKNISNYNLNIKEFYLIIVSNDEEYKIPVYLGDTIGSNETKPINVSLNKDINNITSIKYEIRGNIYE